ncbi:MAG: DegT/DnrJ/EryC1/StrS family aminotransferase [Sulfuritalea sp.]|nr:DegT/DnrJ/EryC1/StrS family aminotransferase [Sulfuritalea sp.]
MKKISFAGPSITQKEIDYVIDATRNGFYETYDLHTKKLENAITDYLGVKYAIATHCCTMALHLGAAALDIGPDDEVIVTDFSWVATAYAIAYTGAKCVFVDIDPDTWCIDPSCIEAAITSKTKAIMVVHAFGHPAEMDSIIQIARKYGLSVIEDAAPALGAEFKGQKVGTFGDIGCFSFQGAKLTVSGEGGVFVTNDDRLYQRARLLSSMGRTDSKAVFWSDVLGYQYTIANLTAALALAQVERIDELLERKRQIFNWYYDRLRDVPGIKIIKEKEGCKSNYCYPSILLESIVRTDRDLVLLKLKQLNIHCRPGFPQMSRFPLFEQRFSNPVSRSVEERGISLASAANIVEADVEFVCENLISFIEMG